MADVNLTAHNGRRHRTRTKIAIPGCKGKKQGKKKRKGR
jgi:hypothetical protein